LNTALVTAALAALGAGGAFFLPTANVMVGGWKAPAVERTRAKMASFMVYEKG
jgi:hypothetical protein